MKKDSKPEPVKLCLQSKDTAKFKITKIDFTPARFNVGENCQEDSIVTSTGPFLITWNFEKVKKGDLKSYKIIKLSEYVVDN
mmetsp:Transcript_38581/g.28462  ORF Transcript_38581/g.28462 Transcript_38581/m.28462 type:complete len:82 (+) Transcript_38581:397-642(+)|eukprot:CAMPEP_0202960054 /NCGR_PEP_ID=MMETSP1396-20130829/4225_1 /ASSEMBLY_ACC=CAM_ASM_000872 /TAXON_ID= /ORGANISM="Pseudokeronopsis sp., Strain Brazil" /LENGTH=81 /DNA_ID=CAMNT_0049679021 /DNA_START=2116 /DNA_END=2361 /DNA_ORIENTATION=-